MLSGNCFWSVKFHCWEYPFNWSLWKKSGETVRRPLVTAPNDPMRSESENGVTGGSPSLSMNAGVNPPSGELMSKVFEKVQNCVNGTARAYAPL